MKILTMYTIHQLKADTDKIYENRPPEEEACSKLNRPTVGYLQCWAS
jgi:hypothetical protein